MMNTLSIKRTLVLALTVTLPWFMQSVSADDDLRTDWKTAKNKAISDFKSKYNALKLSKLPNSRKKELKLEGNKLTSYIDFDQELGPNLELMQASRKQIDYFENTSMSVLMQKNKKLIQSFANSLGLVGEHHYLKNKGYNKNPNAQWNTYFSPQASKAFSLDPDLAEDWGKIKTQTRHDSHSKGLSQRASELALSRMQVQWDDGFEDFIDYPALNKAMKIGDYKVYYKTASAAIKSYNRDLNSLAGDFSESVLTQPLEDILNDLISELVDINEALEELKYE